MHNHRVTATDARSFSEDFVRAGRAGEAFVAPTAEFDFGPFRVKSQITHQSGLLPRRGVAGSKCHLNVSDSASDTAVVCELERVGMPLGRELLHGIQGSLDGQPFLVRRTARVRLRRRDRVVHVSGAIDLTLGYESRSTTLRVGGPAGRLLWTSSSGGLLARDATHREAAVACVLVVNSVDQSGSLLRFLSFL